MTTSAARRTRGWLRTRTPVPGARLRLVCLPHAGGAASAFRAWPALVPPDVELTAVQYPGREDRIREQPWTSVTAMADELVSLLAPDDRPLVLFGHSLGGTVAYEVARRLPRPPLRLVVSARIAPTVPPARVFRGRTDAELAEELFRLGGTTRAVLEHAELRDLVLPAFRADLTAADSYTHTQDPPLRCPVRLLLGADDPAVDPTDAARWAAVAPAFEQHTFPGGHFYLFDRPGEVLAEVLAEALR